MINFPVSEEWTVLSEAVNPQTGHYTQTLAMPVAWGGVVLRVTTMLNGNITENMLFIPDACIITDAETERSYIQRNLLVAENAAQTIPVTYTAKGV